MKLIIKGTHKEVADFILQIQSQPNNDKEPCINVNKVRGAKITHSE